MSHLFSLHVGICFVVTLIVLVISLYYFKFYKRLRRPKRYPTKKQRKKVNRVQTSTKSEKATVHHQPARATRARFQFMNDFVTNKIDNVSIRDIDASDSECTESICREFGWENNRHRLSLNGFDLSELH
jgi:hypothetical protein